MQQPAFAGHILGWCSVVGVSGKIQPMEQEALFSLSRLGWPVKIEMRRQTRKSLLTKDEKGAFFMSITLVHSKVKAEKVADVEAGIKRLVPTLEQAQLDMRYAWFRLDDGVTYVILVEYGEGGNNLAANLPEFQAFMEILNASKDGLPTTEQLTLSGSYRVF